jgi:hypothetical protein
METQGPDCELGGKEHQISFPEGFPYYRQQHVVEHFRERRGHILNDFSVCFVRVVGFSSFGNIVLLKWRRLR